MTTQRIVEKVVAAALFSQQPQSGDFFKSSSGLTIFSVSRVRRVVGDRQGPCYRLVGMRVKASDVPATATILPWPRRAQRSRTVTDIPIVPSTPRPIVTRLQTQRAARKRIIDLKWNDTDYRLTAGHAVEDTWRDPDDSNVRRREAKVVHGIRAICPIEKLLTTGTLGRAQGHAAKRFRRLYELGELGCSGRDLGSPPVGFQSGTGPSERRLISLRAYQAAAAALRPHLLEVVLAIIIHGTTIEKYAERRRLNRGVAGGLLLGGVQFLTDYFKELDDKEREAEPSIPAMHQPA